MPLELGIFLGAKRFGVGEERRKVCLVLDREQYRYHKFCSDIAGQDIRNHGNTITGVVTAVRNWLRNNSASGSTILPGGPTIRGRYLAFKRDLPRVCAAAQVDPDALEFNDFTTFVVSWLEVQAP